MPVYVWMGFCTLKCGILQTKPHADVILHTLWDLISNNCNFQDFNAWSRSDFHPPYPYHPIAILAAAGSAWALLSEDPYSQPPLGRSHM